MATVSLSQDNIFPIPMNCTVNKKTGYVLANLTNEYASSNSKGKCSYSTHVLGLKSLKFDCCEI